MYSEPFWGRSAIRKFECFEKDVDVKKLLEEFSEGAKNVQRNQVLPSAHKESVHIGLRVAQRTRLTKNFYHGNIIKNKLTEYYGMFPKTTAWMENFAAQNNSLLQRAFIAILQPHGKVYCHFDAGIYFATCERYHLVLQSEGTIVLVENERSIFRKGEVWWFNNCLYHEFLHESDQERIHLIFDLQPRSFAKKLRNLSVWIYLFYVHKLQGAGKTGGPPKKYFLPNAR